MPACALISFFQVLFKTANAEGSIRQYRKDIEDQNHTLRSLEDRLAESRQMSHLLNIYLKKCSRELKEMETTTELLSRMRRTSLFKTNHEEKLFADDDKNQVQTAAQVLLISMSDIVFYL